jgi:hypothetical protein
MVFYRNMSTEFCILCGHVLGVSDGRRYKKYDAMRELVIQKCIPTTFVYASVVRCSNGVGKHTVCIACVNWTRRLSLKTSQQLIYIPMDNVILFVAQPGQHAEPDKRTLVRLLRSLSAVPPLPVNHYTCFETGAMTSLKKVLVEKGFFDGTREVCEETDAVAEYDKDLLIDTIIRVWWIFNGMPTFLSDKSTGRYVRRMLRAHRVDSLPLL